MKNIAVLCSGGDVSGMNPGLKRFVEYSLEKGLTPYFVHSGYEGLIDNLIFPATYNDVSGILTRGGTKIGSRRSLRFMQPEYRAIAKANLDALSIDKLVVMGGDGSFRGLEIFYREHGINFCGIPSTIDNDISGTDYCLGVDTALNVIKEAIDSIRDTASSFGRAFVIETMGRDCGYLALVTALTSGAEMCLIPELDIDLEERKKCFKAQIENGRNYFIAIVAEGAGCAEDVAKWFKEELNFESRATVLGHLQRGGNPTVHDRLMAYKFVTYAINALLEGNNNSIICHNNNNFNFKSIDEVAFIPYELDRELLALASAQFRPRQCRI